MKTTTCKCNIRIRLTKQISSTASLLLLTNTHQPQTLPSGQSSTFSSSDSNSSWLKLTPAHLTQSTLLIILASFLMNILLFLIRGLLSSALSAVSHLVSGINFLSNFANLLMISPCHCHQILLTPVHHRHHHFHYASLLLSSTQDSKLTFSVNPSYCIEFL